MALDLFIKFSSLGKGKALKDVEQMRAAVKRASNMYKEFEATARRTGARTDRVSLAFRNLNDAFRRGDSIKSVQKNLQSFDRVLSKTSVKMQGLTRSTKGSVKSSKDFVDRMDAMARSVRIMEGPLGGTAARLQTFVAILKTGKAGAIGFVFAVAGVTVGVGLLAKGVIRVRLELERMENALKFAEGSAGKAEEALSLIKKTSSELGLNITKTGKQFALLSAATQGTVFQGRLARDLFLAVAKASAALGLSADDTAGIFRAFQQMISKGSVQAEELRGQLGERLPGAFRLAAKAMGTSTRGLAKMLEKGEVLASDLLPRLIPLLDETFSGAALEGAKTLNAAVNRVKTSWDLFLDSLDRTFNVSKVAKGALNALSGTLDRLADRSADIATAGLGTVVGLDAQIFGLKAARKELTDALVDLQFGREREERARGRPVSGTDPAFNNLMKRIAIVDAAIHKAIKAKRILLETERIRGPSGEISETSSFLALAKGQREKLAGQAEKLFTQFLPANKELQRLETAKELFKNIFEKEVIPGVTEATFIAPKLGKTIKELRRDFEELLRVLQTAADKKLGFDADKIRKDLDKTKESARKFRAGFEGRMDVLGALRIPDKRTRFVETALAVEEARLARLGKAVRIQVGDMTTELELFKAAAGRAFDFREVTRLIEQFKSPSERFIERMDRLNELMERFPQHATALGKAMVQAKRDLIAVDPILSTLSRSFDTLGKGIVDVLGKGEDALETFKNTVKRIADDILATFLQLAVINPIKNAIFGEGVFPTLAGALGGSSQTAAPGFASSVLGGSPINTTLGSFASGGSFKVGGTGGVDTQPVKFNASPGEEVTVLNRQQQKELDRGRRGGDTFIIDARGADPGQLRRLEAMIRAMDSTLEKRAFAAAVEGSSRRIRFRGV